MVSAGGAAGEAEEEECRVIGHVADAALEDDEQGEKGVSDGESSDGGRRMMQKGSPWAREWEPRRGRR